MTALSPVRLSFFFTPLKPAWLARECVFKVAGGLDTDFFVAACVAGATDCRSVVSVCGASSWPWFRRLGQDRRAFCGMLWFRSMTTTDMDIEIWKYLRHHARLEFRLPTSPDLKKGTCSLVLHVLHKRGREVRGQRRVPRL